VALPWGRVKPILSTLGELYFNDKIKTRVRLSTLDAARLEELARGAELQLDRRRRLRETGRKLSQFGKVKEGRRRPACRPRCATTSSTAWPGCNSCANTTWPASWPTTWAWARPCRPWPTS
jgi:hypothetical protein